MEKIEVQLGDADGGDMLVAEVSGRLVQLNRVQDQGAKGWISVQNLTVPAQYWAQLVAAVEGLR